ncbi:MAG: thioredoxin family protein [Dysgonomonas sp.]|uniref:thioredoxin family protein n=1 Tax=Dysgonomonas TaxID=156973 RepID=UPI0033428D63
MNKIIKFEKTDCNPCVMVSQYLDSKSISFEAINPFDNPELAVKYKVRSVPTTILLKDNDELMRSIGYQPEELNKIIDAL